MQSLRNQVPVTYSREVPWRMWNQTIKHFVFISVIYYWVTKFTDVQFGWVRNLGVASLSCLAQLLPWGAIGWDCRNLMAWLGPKNLVLKLLTRVAVSRRSMLTQLVVGSNPLLAFDRTPRFLDTHPAQRDCFHVLMTWQLASSEGVIQEREGQDAVCHTASHHHIPFVRNESLNPVQDQGNVSEGKNINNS